MQNIQKFIESEIEQYVKHQFDLKELQHNHPPLRFKVDGCEYCHKYGNVFEKPSHL